MTWIVSAGAAVVVFPILFLMARKLRRSTDSELRGVGMAMMVVAILLLVGVVGIYTPLASAHQIPAGNIGIVYQFGEIKDQIGEGFQWVAPWRNVKMANIQIQRHVFERLESFSKETQTVYVKASLNISVSPQAIQQLYRTVGEGYFGVLVESRVHQNFKDELVRYNTVDIAPNRENIRKAVRERLEHELSSHSIKVEDLLLDNVDFKDEFEHAIEQKQVATQKALEEEQKVVVERHRAEQALEKARGEGNSILAIAEKQAEANRKLGESLTPTLVQYTMAQKLSDKIQVMILPSNQSFILDGKMLKEPQQEK